MRHQISNEFIRKHSTNSISQGSVTNSITCVNNFFLNLTADTQLFVLAPLLIYPLWKSKKFGLYLLSIATAMSVMIPFYVTFTQKLDPTFIVWPRQSIKILSTRTLFSINVFFAVKCPISLLMITSYLRTERHT